MPDETERADAIGRYVDAAHDRIYSLALCHYAAADRYAAYRMRLGVPSIILCAFAAAAVGGDAESLPMLLDTVDKRSEQDVDLWPVVIRLGILGIVIISGIFTSLMTFFDYETKAAKHHETGKRYSVILRHMESFRVRIAGMENVKMDDVRSEFDEITSEEQDVSASAPPIPSKAIERVNGQIASERLALTGGGNLPDPRKRFKRLHRY